MPSVSISITKGAGSFNHNERKFSTPNVDPGRSHLNVKLQPNRIKEVYHELFDQALSKYNAKQKRNDRKIKDYYSHISNSKKGKTFHELIVQVGNRDDDQSRFNDILEEYHRGFEERNPNMRICAAYIHNDEQTPHLHLDYVPFVTNQKRGLETKVANDEAIKQMGYSSYKEWRANEEQVLEQILQHHGLERAIMNNTDKHRSVQDYKAEQRMIEKRIQRLDQQVQATPVEVKTNVFGMETVKKSDFDLIDEKNKLLEAELSVLSDVSEKQEQKLASMNKKPYIALNKALREENEELQSNNDEAYDYIIELQQTTVPVDQYQKLEKQYQQVLPYKELYQKLKNKYEPTEQVAQTVQPNSIREQIALAKKVKQKKTYDDLEQENRKLKQEVSFWKSRFESLIENLEMFFGKLRDSFGYFLAEDDVDQILEESIDESFDEKDSVFEVFDISKSKSLSEWER